MAKVICPACEARLALPHEDLSLYARFRCTSCDALLEVIDENPLELDWIFEDDEDAEDGED